MTALPTRTNVQGLHNRIFCCCTQIHSLNTCFACAESCADSKQAHTELARSYQEEMEGLASRAPSAWPSQVRQLVEAREKAAVSSAESAAHAEAEAAEAEFEAEADRLRELAAEHRSKQQQAQAQM